jgi:hypothetical protein
MTDESYRSLQFVKFSGPFSPLCQLRFPRYLSSTAYVIGIKNREQISIAPSNYEMKKIAAIIQKNTHY